jgi:hypothetical protein
MKEFYKKANSLLKIKRSNPVVTKVQREDELGETQIYEDKSPVDYVISQYFADIYKRPDYRRE